MTPSTPKPTRARGEAPADERTAGLTRRQRLVLETINEAVAARGSRPRCFGRLGTEGRSRPPASSGSCAGRRR